MSKKRFGKCTECRCRMEVGDELPEERVCDKCAGGVLPNPFMDLPKKGKRKKGSVQ